MANRLSELLPDEASMPVMATFSKNSLGANLAAMSAAEPATAAYPTANVAYFVPFVITKTSTAVRMSIINGGTASGNIDVGIYDASFNRLVSKGSTAQSGTSAPQHFDITDTILIPGLYYMAVAFDNGTGTMFRYTATSELVQRFTGTFRMAAAFPLPASATAATIATTFIPFVAVSFNASLPV